MGHGCRGKRCSRVTQKALRGEYVLDSGRDSVNGLDLPFCSAKLAQGFRFERGFHRQTKAFGWVKSVMGKAKKKQIKEYNIMK